MQARPMTLRITSHAVERYQERVANVTPTEARIALTSPVIAKAADFGAPYVKLGTGQHVVLEGRVVVTVLPKDEHPGCFAPDRDAVRRAVRHPLRGERL
jgi:hypothetical protein